MGTEERIQSKFTNRVEHQSLTESPLILALYSSQRRLKVPQRQPLSWDFARNWRTDEFSSWCFLSEICPQNQINSPITLFLFKVTGTKRFICRRLWEVYWITIGNRIHAQPGTPTSVRSKFQTEGCQFDKWNPVEQTNPAICDCGWSRSVVMGENSQKPSLH